MIIKIVKFAPKRLTDLGCLKAYLSLNPPQLIEEALRGVGERVTAEMNIILLEPLTKKGVLMAYFQWIL